MVTTKTSYVHLYPFFLLRARIRVRNVTRVCGHFWWLQMFWRQHWQVNCKRCCSKSRGLLFIFNQVTVMRYLTVDFNDICRDRLPVPKHIAHSWGDGRRRRQPWDSLRDPDWILSRFAFPGLRSSAAEGGNREMKKLETRKTAGVQFFTRISDRG